MTMPELPAHVWVYPAATVEGHVLDVDEQPYEGYEDRQVKYHRHDLYEALEYQVKIHKDLVDEKDNEIEALEAENKRLAGAVLILNAHITEVQKMYSQPYKNCAEAIALAQRIGGKNE